MITLNSTGVLNLTNRILISITFLFCKVVLLNGLYILIITCFMDKDECNVFRVVLEYFKLTLYLLIISSQNNTYYQNQ